MGPKLRKFFVWLISLAAVLAIYLLYNQLSGTREIDIDTLLESTGAIADSNADQGDGEIGMIGDVGVSTVKKAIFTTLNKQKQIDREFGFEKLLHETADNWELEKPFMNIFRRDFICSITADRGQVQVETAAGKPTPKDAILTGNVVIHILPQNESSVKESFIYLDDVVFISERSQFSTAGPVKFVSQDAHLLGKGLELVYNDQLDRLEFLRITHLDSLNIKQSSKASLFAQTTPPEAPASDVPDTQPAETTKLPSSQTDLETTKRSDDEMVNRPTAQPALYRCVFSKNVVIDGPQQLIFADEVSINNISRHGTSDEKSENEAYPGKREAEPPPAIEAQDTEHRESSIKILRSPQDASRRTPNGGDTEAEQPADIVVTCDGGIFVTPMDSHRTPEDFAEIEPEATTTAGKRLEDLGDTTGRPTFAARRIDYSASTGDTVATGPSELVFYVNDIAGTEGKKSAVPVKVTAREKTKFSPASNQIIFEGDCRCITESGADSPIRQKYTLSAPKLTVNLTAGGTPDIEHLTADGRTVQLDTSKWAGEELLGFVKLKCHRFDYDALQQSFLATGPGLIVVDNSKIAKPQKETAKFSLKRQCYAVVRDFETLQYCLKTNRVIADAAPQRMLIDYFPIVNGQYGQQIAATAGHIEADLYETTDGRTELSTLKATGGIFYEEEDIQFIGSKLFYDADSSIITAEGDESQPCLLNGAFVDEIEYNLKTGKAKSKIIAPGTLQMR